MKITEFLFFARKYHFFCLLLPKKIKIRLKIKNINKNIDRLYKIVYYIVKSALCIVWDSTKTVGAGCLWKSYVISCKFRKVLYHLDTACIWTENMDRAKKRGENIVLVVGLRCYLKKEEGGKKVRNVTGFITVIMYGRENV